MTGTSDKIYTRKGDRGETSLLSGDVVFKDDARVRTYGAVDELQCHLGMARAWTGDGRVAEIVQDVQRDLFAACSELASSPAELGRLQRRLAAGDAAKLEAWIDETVESYSTPKGFVVPGRSRDSAALHVARAVCRRCERLIVALDRKDRVHGELVRYFNRLSDLLFVLAWRLEVNAVICGVLKDLNGGARDATDGRITR